MPWWIWMVVGLLFLGAELILPGGIVMLFFGAAALIVGLLAALSITQGTVWIELALFSTLSVVSLFILREPILRRMQLRADEPSDLDSLIGSRVVAVSEIAPGGEGKVELRGTSWSGRNIGDNPIEAAGLGLVEQLDGLILLVRGSGET